MSELTQALLEAQRANQRTSQVIEGLLKKKESQGGGSGFKPGDVLEVAADGSIKLSESAEAKRLQESTVKGFMGFGLSRAQAERAAAGRERRV